MAKTNITCHVNDLRTVRSISFNKIYLQKMVKNNKENLEIKIKQRLPNPESSGNTLKGPLYSYCIHRNMHGKMGNTLEQLTSTIYPLKHFILNLDTRTWIKKYRCKIFL